VLTEVVVVVVDALDEEVVDVVVALMAVDVVVVVCVTVDVTSALPIAEPHS